MPTEMERKELARSYDMLLGHLLGLTLDSNSKTKLIAALDQLYIALYEKPEAPLLG